MESCDVVIIGAGISGLITALEISKTGKKVIVIEARQRAGGRIQTISPEEFPVNAEAGAEFIHGKLPHIFRLLNDYDIPVTEAEGETWHLSGGYYHKHGKIISEYEPELKQKLSQLITDMSVAEFMDTYFPSPQFIHLTSDVTRFVEGYDGGDINKASALSLREELESTEDRKQFRVTGGLSRLTDVLLADCERQHCNMQYGNVADLITWKENDVNIHCTNDVWFHAKSVVVTVPLGVLKSNALRFSPGIPAKENAIQNLQMGEVIKILLCFRDRFWTSRKTEGLTGQNFSKLFFLFSDAVVPTWWTQYPDDNPLLTGWLSGSHARKRRYYAAEDIYKEAIASLSYIFRIPMQSLYLAISGKKIVHWTQDPFSNGAYVYSTVNSWNDIALLERPVENTIFFAGELFAPESGVGMVEAAIASALKTAHQVTIRLAA